MSERYQCRMFLHTFFKEMNQFISKLILSGFLHTYLSSVVLVGAEAFMRFLSWRISQHHLHLHAIHRLAVEHRHGIICTLESQRNRGNERPVQGQIQRQVLTQLKRTENFHIFCSCSKQKAASPVCLHT